MNVQLADTLSLVFENQPIKKYKINELISRQGDVITDVAFIKKGYVRLFTSTYSGKETTINLFKPVFLLTLIYARKNKESPYSMEAVTEVELWKIPKDEFFSIMKENTAVLNATLTHSLEVLDLTLKNVLDASHISAVNRISSIIYSLCKQVKKDKGKTEIEFSMTKKLIASLAGTSRETATLEIKKLEAMGLLKIVKGKIHIPDPEALKNIVQ